MASWPLTARPPAHLPQACNLARQPGPFFTFLLIIWSSSASISALFRLMAFTLPDLIMAQAAGGIVSR